jgi:hypothetical protein
MPVVWSPSLTFSLSERSRKDTIVYGPDRRVVFWVETNKDKRGTVLYRASGPLGAKCEITFIDFKLFGASKVLYQGKEQDLNALFPWRMSWRGRYVWRHFIIENERLHHLLKFQQITTEFDSDWWTQVEGRAREKVTAGTFVPPILHKLDQ